MPYITNTRSVFGRLEDNHHHPFPDPLEDNDDDVTPTPSPATARRRLPLLQRPPVSSITTTTRRRDLPLLQRPPVSSITTTTRRRDLPLGQRPPVSSIITTTTKRRDPDKRSTVHGISTKGTNVQRGDTVVPRGKSLNNDMRRAQVFQHLRNERGSNFVSTTPVSTTPPTRRRLGDELEGLQVQQVVDITTPESARTHVPTAVTANAVTVTRKRRPSPEDIAVSDAIATMASMSKRRRHVTSTTNITTTRDTSSMYSGSTTGGTPTSMRSTGSIGRTASWVAARPVDPPYADFSFGPPCDGCLAEFCVNMQAVHSLKAHALKFFSPEVHDLPALISKNGQRRHALFNWNKKNTGLSSIKKTPYCVVVFARKWFPEKGHVFKRAPPPQAASSPPWIVTTTSNNSNSNNNKGMDV